MSKITTVNNTVQKYILSQLINNETARFKDLQPPKTSSNALSYHLKRLVADDWVQKTATGYTLAAKGLAYAARNTTATASGSVRMQPSVAIALVVQDPEGRILLQQRASQPYIHQWQLPTANATVADESVLQAGKWFAKQLFKHVPDTLRHSGDCYVRIHRGKVALQSTLVHIVRLEADPKILPDTLAWFEPLDVEKLATYPGTEQIMTRAFFNDIYFFEEYTLQANNQSSLNLTAAH